ncbi:hypothetical protein KR093_004810 [Drosophila rubida]|uniref:Uncharacterized protein n=1 Tax=Drosophila rubida TaxID=30044 RepID=A0AAD4JZB7_9MUSC|nr:hypothetical protein KR093_004810 [Drosophila rubida]
MHIDDIYRRYKKARRRFSLLTYLMLLVWLCLALAQWMVVSLIQDVRDIFRIHYYVSVAAFGVAIFLFAIFLFFEGLRYNKIVAFIFAFLIVELQIVALFTLIARTYWAETLLYFLICAVVIFIFVFIGLLLPRKMDLTLHIALLFILAFLFLLATVFFLMHQLLVSQMWRDIKDFGFLLVELPISLTILFFVMYHGQTINGGRFAEMRLHDYCLGSLILFHDFLIIYWLTFYWQMISAIVTPDDWTQLSTIWHQNKMLPFDYEDYTEGMNQPPAQPTQVEEPPRPTLEEPTLAITLDFMSDDVQKAPKLGNRSFRINRLKKDRRQMPLPNRQVTTEGQQRRYMYDEGSNDY